MALTASYPQFWAAAAGQGLSSGFWFSVLQIVLINVLLWGDNAVVIAMTCRRLPPRQRMLGIAIGAGASAALLIVFAVLVTRLMAYPYLKLLGGLALLYIAIKLIAPRDASAEIEAATQLWRALRIIILADLVMSFDNVIAIAAAGRGNIVVVAVGLAISLPIILGGAALIMTLLNRYPIFAWAGAALLGWVAGSLVAGEPAVAEYLTARFGHFAGDIHLLTGAAGAALVVLAGALWRLWRRFKGSGTPPAPDEAGRR